MGLGKDRKNDRPPTPDPATLVLGAFFHDSFGLVLPLGSRSRVQTGVNNVKRSGGDGGAREGGWHRARANEQLITNAFTPKRQWDDAPPT